MAFCLDARTSTPHFPGIGRYISNLARRLPLFLPPGGRLEMLHDARYPLDVEESSRLRLHPCRVSPFSLSQQRVIPHKLAELGIRLYHSPYYLMPYRPGAATVLTVHDLIPLVYPQTVSPQARLFFRLGSTLALHAADEIIAISEATRSDYLAHFASHFRGRLSPHKIHTIPLAASERFSPQPAAEVERVRQKYHLPENYLLYLGINKPHKNLVRLLQAWKDALAQLAQAPEQLVIAGAWDERYPHARQAAQALELGQRVRFLGSVAEPDLPALYSGAKLFVFPSMYEGFGLPVLEALACETPVACSRTSSLPEVAGEAGEYFEPESVVSITTALLRCLARPGYLEELRAKSTAQARRFSWERTASATMDVYQLVTNTQ